MSYINPLTLVLGIKPLAITEQADVLGLEVAQPGQDVQTVSTLVSNQRTHDHHPSPAPEVCPTCITAQPTAQTDGCAPPWSYSMPTPSTSSGTTQLAARIPVAAVEQIRQLQEQTNCPSVGVLIRRALVHWAEAQPAVDPVLAVQLHDGLISRMRNGGQFKSPTSAA